MRRRIPDELDRLYKAVENYVAVKGGAILVIGGVQVQEWPGSPLGKFVLGVECLGHKPTFASHRPEKPVGRKKQPTRKSTKRSHV